MCIHKIADFAKVFINVLSPGHATEFWKITITNKVQSTVDFQPSRPELFFTNLWDGKNDEARTFPQVLGIGLCPADWVTHRSYGLFAWTALHIVYFFIWSYSV